jgi:hypothetical protein
MPLIIRIVLCLVAFAGSARANDAFPLPFEGLYESRGSVAKEKVGDGEWRDIPQDVQLRISKDGNIAELQLRIQVRSAGDGDAPTTRTIANDIWLVVRPERGEANEAGRVAFDVYKRPDGLDRFEDQGDGYCLPSECRFSYVTAKPGHRQRYESRMTWRAASADTEFHQSGGLSLEPAGKADWSTFKTWENVFKRVVPGP